MLFPHWTGKDRDTFGGSDFIFRENQDIHQACSHEPKEGGTQDRDFLVAISRFDNSKICFRLLTTHSMKHSSVSSFLSLRQMRTFPFEYWLLLTSVKLLISHNLTQIFWPDTEPPLFMPCSGIKSKTCLVFYKSSLIFPHKFDKNS